MGIVVAILSYRQPQPADSGFDGSWRYALAIASARHLVFGRDLAYTYGPLGWLGAPIMSGYHVVALRVILACIAVAVGLSVVRLASMAARLSIGMVVAGLAVSAFAWPGLHGVAGIEPDYQLIFISVIAVVTGISSPRYAEPACVVVGFCSGLAIAVKTIAVVDIGAVFAVGIGMTIWSEPRRGLRLALCAALAFLVSAAMSLADPLAHGTLLAFMRDSIDIAGGYTAAMSDGPSANETHAAVITIIVGLALLVLWGRRGRLPIAAVCCVFLVLGWKHAIIREGLEHASYLYATVALIAAIVIAFSNRRRDAFLAAFVGVAALVHLVTLYSVNHEGVQPTLAEAVIRDPPARWAGRTIDALPMDTVSAILSTGIYRPLPMFQLLTAYTPELDALDAAALHAHGADVVLYRFATIGNRYVFADGPLVVRGLLCGYLPSGSVRSQDDRQFVELRRSVDRCSQRALPAPAPNTPVRLPDVRPGDFISAQIDFALTSRGRADALIWRLNLPLLEFRLKSGRTVTQQIAAPTARDGIVLDPAPLNADDAARMFGETLGGNVASFTVHPGQDYAVRSVSLLLTHRSAGPGSAGRSRP